MKKKFLYKKIKKIFLPILVFVSFFALCFSVMYANADTFVNQDAPFIIQGTATNNNTTIDPVGDVAYLVEKRGHSEVVNGEIVDANGKDLVCIGRQVWNEIWEIGGLTWDTGEETSSGGRFRSLDFIYAIPNRDYYFYHEDGTLGVVWYDDDYSFISSNYSVDGVETSPINAKYFRIVNVGSESYSNNITISLYYADEDGYDEYYPYQLLTQVDTGTEVLRSAGNAFDVKTSNGVIVRNIDYISLADLSWDNTGSIFYANVVDKVVGSFNILCSKYLVDDSYFGSAVPDGYISVGSANSYIYINDSNYSTVESFVSSVSDVILYYETISPIQEQGTSYNQVLSVDDFGSMYWLDEDGDLITIPQGNHVTYVYSFVYAWTEPIWRIFPEVFKDLGSNVLKFIKDGFVKLFVNQVEVDGLIEYQPSEISYFVFALMGISLICGLTYYIVNMLRRSR